MKKTLLTVCLSVVCIMATAQTTFDQKITANASKLNTVTNVQQLDALFADFSVMVKAESPNRWKAYYYAGLTQYRKAEMLLKTNNISGATEANAIAFKYVSVVPAENKDAVKLLEQISEQRLKLTRVFAAK